MKVDLGKTIYYGGHKIKADQEIPDFVEKALKEPEKTEVIKNESPRTGGSGSRKKP
jgi:hypothetical protein